MGRGLVVRAVSTCAAPARIPALHAMIRRGAIPTANAAPSVRIRCLSSTAMGDEELRQRLDVFQDLFTEARMCIEDCQDAAETTYFDEEAETAREAVQAAIDNFEELLGDLDARQKQSVMQGNGLKVEQLKGELELALNGGHH